MVARQRKATHQARGELYEIMVRDVLPYSDVRGWERRVFCKSMRSQMRVRRATLTYLVKKVAAGRDLHEHVDRGIVLGLRLRVNDDGRDELKDVTMLQTAMNLHLLLQCTPLLGLRIRL